MKKKSQPGESGHTQPEREEAFVDSFWYEVFFAFGEPESDKEDYAILEMVHFARFCHARVLADFLESKGGNDDLKANEFKDKNGTCWKSNWKLDDVKRKKLNKQLMHLSVNRATQYTHDDKAWDHSIFDDLRDPVVDFMKWVEKHRPGLAAHSRCWSGLLARLEKGDLPFKIKGEQFEDGQWVPRLVEPACDNPVPPADVRHPGHSAGMNTNVTATPGSTRTSSLPPSTKLQD